MRILTYTIAAALLFISQCSLAQVVVPVLPPPLPVIPVLPVPDFGAAGSVAVMVYYTINNSGKTVICGDLVTWYPDTQFRLEGTVNNGVEDSHDLAQGGSNPKSNWGVIYNAAITLTNKLQNHTLYPTTQNLSGTPLGNLKDLAPGVYDFTGNASLTGNLILDDGGDKNALYIFRVNGNLTTFDNSSVSLKSKGSGPNVFWLTNEATSLGANSMLAGNIVTTNNPNQSSILLKTGATVTGKVLNLFGSISFNSNSVCAMIDTDGDGVPDDQDDYPLDPTKAHNNFTTAQTTAFEDNWPAMGDYDMNDLVMEYTYNTVTNARNQVVQVIGNYNLKATGGINKNAFGVEFPLSAASIKNVAGGTQEPGQGKAVVMLFGNMRSEMAGWNTLAGVPMSAVKTYTVNFDVVNGPQLADFVQDGFNPFIMNMVGGLRAEVHRPGKTPTTLADKKLFNTGDDATNISAGSTYVTKTGLPYAISLPTAAFSYPFEMKDISAAYLHFGDWAASGGKSFADWYSNTGPGYRNDAMIFQKPQ